MKWSHWHSTSLVDRHITLLPFINTFSSVTKTEKEEKSKEGENLMDGFQKEQDCDTGVWIKRPAETLKKDVEKHKASFSFSESLKGETK